METLLDKVEKRLAYLIEQDTVPQRELFPFDEAKCLRAIARAKELGGIVRVSKDIYYMNVPDVIWKFRYNDILGTVDYNLPPNTIVAMDGD